MKERLDKYLCENGYFETKSKAQAAIMAGDVKINGVCVTKSGFQIKPDEKNIIEIKSLPFVSRGGLKLDKAIKTFNPELQGRVCLDAGASTGGFTDCLLQNGAAKVYAVDVGYGQIAWKLRTDPRVKTIERTNIRNCDKSSIFSENDELPTLCVMDLSFISITKVLHNILNLMDKNNFEIISLIKPQFECSQEEVGKNGVVREKSTHRKVITNIVNFVQNELNLYPINLTYSSIKGPAGNIEYLVWFSTEGEGIDVDIKDVVEAAHEKLN